MERKKMDTYKEEEAQEYEFLIPRYNIGIMYTKYEHCTLKSCSEMCDAMDKYMEV